MSTKVGARLRSVVCETEVIVVRAPVTRSICAAAGRRWWRSTRHRRRGGDRPAPARGNAARQALTPMRSWASSSSAQAGEGSLSIGEGRSPSRRRACFRPPTNDHGPVADPRPRRRWRRRADRDRPRGPRPHLPRCASRPAAPLGGSPRDRPEHVATSAPTHPTVPDRPVRQRARRPSIRADQLPAPDDRLEALHRATGPGGRDRRRRRSLAAARPAAIDPGTGSEYLAALGTAAPSPEPLAAARSRRGRRAALHERNDGRGEGGGPAPPPPRRLRRLDRRIPGRRARTRRHSSACRPTTWHRSRRSSPPSTPAGASSTCAPSTPSAGSPPPARSRSPTRWSCPPCSLASSRSSSATATAFPALRHLSYGGGPMPVAVLERALARLPEVGFVNAYGLTETSSTIALLGPEEHRAAMASEDPRVRRRLRSVGRPLPTVEVAIVDAAGDPLAPGRVGRDRRARGAGLRRVPGRERGATAGSVRATAACSMTRASSTWTGASTT